MTFERLNHSKAFNDCNRVTPLNGLNGMYQRPSLNFERAVSDQRFERSEAFERLEHLELSVRPWTLNEQFPINVLNEAKRLNGWNDWNRFSYPYGARHPFSLELGFRPEKVSSKPSDDRFYAILQS